MIELSGKPGRSGIAGFERHGNRTGRALRDVEPPDRLFHPIVAVLRIGLGPFATGCGAGKTRVLPIHRLHLGERCPGDASHALMRCAVSACPAFLSNISRCGPGGRHWAASRASSAALFNRSSNDDVCLRRFRLTVMTHLPLPGKQCRAIIGFGRLRRLYGQRIAIM
ncbi:MAG TPA: hypothetical protein VMM15_08265 [Bradyrhizobium sp.]|nr:hypothetical protein [Bradyrhizobium sp.]